MLNEQLIRTFDFKVLKKFVFLPLYLLLLSEVIFFFHSGISQKLKVGAYLLMFLMAFFYKKADKNLYYLFVAFLVLLLYHVFISFSLKAGIEDGLRYLFPVAILFYSYVLRDSFKAVFVLLIAYCLLNNAFQFVNYGCWIVGLSQPIKAHWTSGYLRAGGFIGFFAAFGYLNFICYLLVYYYWEGRYRGLLLTVFSVFVLLSTSFKIIAVFLVVLFLQSTNKMQYISVLLGFCLLVFSVTPDFFNNILNSLLLRVELYIVGGESARSESYKVMFDYLTDFNLTGIGVGAFGGPASTKYNSPFYELVNFNWYGHSYLDTTDTYFPHVFVELGLIGGVVYLLLLLSPFFKQSFAVNKVMLLIYFSIFFDSLFSFALNNSVYLASSLLLTYPVIFYTKKNRLKRNG